MPKTRRRRGSSRTRRAGTKSRRGKRGGSLLAGVVGALKTALPSIVLYEALRAQGKRTKRGGKSYRKRGRGRRNKRGKGTRRHRRK